MDKIKYFFECLLPTSQCNIECEYCYLIQENRRTMKQISLDYSVEHMIKALSKNRLKGTCYFSICGTGETLLQKESVQLVHGLLKEGHYVNITTNGTISKRIEEILDFDSELLKHLHISFSFHYLELEKRNLVKIFFENIKKVKSANVSVLVQFNLYDGYLPYLDTMKKLCLDNVGFLPQVALTRLEKKNDNMEIHSKLDRYSYIEKGKLFNSPLFDFTCENFMVRRKEFCYAGEWSFTLNLKNGDLKACYSSYMKQNIFKDIHKLIKTQAVGNNCNSPYCINSSHFMSLGIIPQINTPSYADLRNRKESKCYSYEMESFLNQKLYDNNKEYSKTKKRYVNMKNSTIKMLSKGKNLIKRTLKSK